MEWYRSQNYVNYSDAIDWMEKRVAAIQKGEESEAIWLLEHPPLYTAGTSHLAEDLLSSKGFPTYQTGRGGEWTYHGPGQRVVYIMLDLKRRDQCDLHAYIRCLEAWIMASLAECDIKSFRDPKHIGVWVSTEEGDKKIAAIGVRVRRWVTYHGVAINVNPELDHFEAIVPCGIRDRGVTSCEALGKKVSLEAFDRILQKKSDKYLNIGGKSFIQNSTIVEIGA